MSDTNFRYKAYSYSKFFLNYAYLFGSNDLESLRVYVERWHKDITHEYGYKIVEEYVIEAFNCV